MSAERMMETRAKRRMVQTREEAPADGVDWKRFAARTWEREPGKLVLPDGPPLPAGEVLAMAVRAAAPFRDGLRFRAVPDVRFFAGGAQLHAPGARLPGPGDRSVDGYLARLRRQHGDRGFQLIISHPLLIDFPLWQRTRAALRGLLAEIGVPVLPIACELLVGSWSRSSGGSQARPHHAAVTWVLHGELVAQLRETTTRARRAGAETAPPQTLLGRAGELLCWPSRHRHEEAGRDCVALRLWIPVAGARVAEAVKDVAVALLDRRRGELERASASHGNGAGASDGPTHRVPYLPLARGGRGGDTAAPLVAAARVLEEVTRDELPRAMQIQWAKRVSALALEPAPPAAAAVPLDETTRLALVAEPLRMPLPDGLEIWAAHGHAFTVRDGAAAAAVLARWRGAPLRLQELPARQRAAGRELAAALLRLRAARVVVERADAGAARPRAGRGRRRA